jgi:putative nucleotidyltransferase with HDIG domain
MSESEPIDRLLRIIQQIAAGNYSNDIMPLTGPDSTEPVRTIAEAMGLMMVKVEAREYRLEMLIDDLRALNEKVRRSTISTIATMAHALEARDPYTEGHARRVGDLSQEIARELGLPEDQVEFVRLAGLLHDIGKIGFPDRLFEPHQAKNPPEVVAAITRHPATSAQILKELDFLGPALEYVYCHHERPDGKGYPRRLKDPEIPLGAKIVAVADGYDAMTTNRPYQGARSPQTALEILQSLAGIQWDPACLEAFARVLVKRGLIPAKK